MKLDKGSPVTLQVAGEIHQLFERTTQEAMLTVGPKSNGTAADTSYVGVMAALAPIMMTAGIFAKVPDWVKTKGNDPDSFTNEDTLRIATEVMTPETVLFAALATAYTMKSFDRTGQLEAGFGPATLWEALEAWTKIYPGLKADNYFDAGMLKAARHAGSEINKPFDAFLAGRITHKDSPETLN